MAVHVAATSETTNENKKTDAHHKSDDSDHPADMSVEFLEGEQNSSNQSKNE